MWRFHLTRRRRLSPSHPASNWHRLCMPVPHVEHRGAVMRTDRPKAGWVRSSDKPLVQPSITSLHLAKHAAGPPDGSPALNTSSCRPLLRGLKPGEASATIRWARVFLNTRCASGLASGVWMPAIFRCGPIGLPLVFRVSTEQRVPLHRRRSAACVGVAYLPRIEVPG